MILTQKKMKSATETVMPAELSNETTAEMLFRKKKGIIDVNLELACCNKSGIGVEKQILRTAYELTKDAYEAGSLWGSKELVYYCENGFGVDQSLEESPQLHHYTYKKGVFETTVAQAYYGHCLIRVRGLKKDIDRWFKLLRGA